MQKVHRYLSPQSPTLSRRNFLHVISLGTAGFVVGCQANPPVPNLPATPTPAHPPAVNLQALNSFVKVGSDGTVTVVIKHAELGQGVTTGLTTIVAEEMDAAWEQMRWEFAPADAERYKNLRLGIQATGGSSSIANSWDQLRLAGAGARQMLVEAAARQWGIESGQIEVAEGRLKTADGRELGFGEVAAAAAQITPPEQPEFKSPEKYRYVGKTVERLDVADKSDGKAQFSLDASLPGMVTAVMLYPPRFGGKVKKVDSAEALEVPGVLEVVTTERGVGVVARDFWAASQGRNKVKVEWDDSESELRGSAELFAHYRELVARPGEVARNDGDVEKALKAGKAIEADYEFPYLAHACMEVPGCLVDLQEHECHLYTGTQIPTFDQANAAGLLGLEPDQIVVHTYYCGGSFGRRGVPDSDYVMAAVAIAKAMQKRVPVKLVRTREDDIKGGRYRPMSVHKVWGSVDKSGAISAFKHRVAVQSILKGTPFGGQKIEHAAVEGSADLCYTVPNLRVELHLPEPGVPALWWRSVGHTHNAYVTETFFDELAHLAGQDPVALRRTMLTGKPRLLKALELALEKAGPAPSDPGRGRGVAVHESFSSFVAEVADVTVNGGKLKVDRVVCAVDCGLAVNPDIVKAQMESGILFALSAALREEVTLKEGMVEQANFDRYQVMRIRDTPEVEVHIVPSTEAPTGVGEPGVPPLAPAVANAIFAATGRRIRSLPFAKHGLV
ncbi:MAG: molybdopterin cofactor-binding domain-containing protein [Vulcanimicrobiota bacterium]